MAEKKDSIRSLIETGRRAGKLTNSEISDAMEESGHVLDVEQSSTRNWRATVSRSSMMTPSAMWTPAC